VEELEAKLEEKEDHFQSNMVGGKKDIGGVGRLTMSYFICIRNVWIESYGP